MRRHLGFKQLKFKVQFIKLLGFVIDEYPVTVSLNYWLTEVKGKELTEFLKKKIEDDGFVVK